MGSPSLVLIEFNELCPPLLDRFMSEGDLPNFARFHAAATVYRTDAGEQYPQLEPGSNGRRSTLRYRMRNTRRSISAMGAT